MSYSNCRQALGVQARGSLPVVHGQLVRSVGLILSIVSILGGERDHFNACGHGLLKVVRALDRKDLSFLEYFYLLGRHSWFGRYVDCERPRDGGSPEEPLVKPIFPSLRPKESRTGPDEGYKPPRISMGDDFGDLKGNVV